MKIQLTNKQIETIAEELDCGLRCFYNIRTKEIKSIIDAKDPLELTSELEEEMAEIEDNWDDYFELEKMDSRSSFQVMAEFIDEIPDEHYQNRLITALNRPKPFRNFKVEIDNHADYRQQWFKFKKQKMIEWVKDRINGFNLRNIEK